MFEEMTEKAHLGLKQRTNLYRQTDQNLLNRDSRNLRYLRYAEKLASAWSDEQLAIYVRENISSLQRWERVSAEIKLTYGTRALLELGLLPFTFTVNLGPIKATKASDHPEGAIGSAYREINSKIKRALGESYPFWVVTEVALQQIRGEKPTTRRPRHAEVGEIVRKPHLHGCIGLASREQVRALRQVMHTVAGDYHHKQTAVSVSLVRDPDRWSQYCAKELGLTPHLVAGGVFASSNCLKQRGRAIYERDREKLKAVLTSNSMAASCDRGTS